MHHFFVNPEQVEDGLIRITGSDVNHIKNVLRIRQGEEMLVSDGTGRDYLCQAEEIAGQEVTVRILETEEEGRELPSRIWLFQGLPKSDKMEFIIQKAVELGAAGIVPVSTRNTVVKLDPKKEEAKVKRWQVIAESAAKQSKRSLVPRVSGIMTLKKPLTMWKARDFPCVSFLMNMRRGWTAQRRSWMPRGRDRTLLCLSARRAVLMNGR